MRSSAGLAPGHLLRSGDITALTPYEAEHLVAQYGLGAVVDLRSDAEVLRYGPPHALLGAGVRWIRCPLGGYPRDVIQAHRPTAAQRADYLWGILTRAEPGCWARLIRALAAAARDPILVTCHFGKDRTGIVVACLLALVGVPDEDIAADYADGAADLLAKVDRFAEKWLRKGHSRQDYLSRMRTSPETMSRLLPRLHSDPAGVRGVLVGVGADPEELGLLAGHLSAGGGDPARDHAGSVVIDTDSGPHRPIADPLPPTIP
ncbi:tyrosine-protein phosphatase [Longimycelium tulufanense]|uniref:tyrosine-protein phosphatase n=1 Tax=Longimycelium tulufanense TaxID=907463 RepID=UPI00166A3506|nr:tyrosine-protein phosphatase [Longimycelium tulufanense]